MTPELVGSLLAARGVDAHPLEAGILVEYLTLITGESRRLGATLTDADRPDVSARTED